MWPLVALVLVSGCGTTLSQVDKQEHARIERELRAKTFRKLAAEARKKAEKARRRGDYLEAVKFAEEADELEAKAKEPNRATGMSSSKQAQIRDQIRFLREAARYARANGEIQRSLQLEQEADRLQGVLHHY